MAETIQENIKLIVFQLKDKEYALPVHQVNAIEKVDYITRVPGLKNYVKGVINLRGVVTPIIDLRLSFGIEGKNYDDTTRVIVVSVNGMDVGLIVDTANDVIDINPSNIEPQPEVVGVHGAEFISGVVKVDQRLLNLLDLEKLLDPTDIKVHTGSEGY